MALPSSGTLSINDINVEAGNTSGTQASLNGLSVYSGFSSPYAITDYYGWSYQELKFNSSYSFYWEWYEYGSFYSQRANVTITPDATFSASSPAFFSRTINQTSNYVDYYPSSANIKTSSVFGTSTLSASGYTCSGDCTVSLEQGGQSGTCTTTAPTCLSSDTMITMSDGYKRKISNIKPGDRVLSFDFENKREVENTIGKVLKTDHDNIVKINFEGGSITCTTDHPFFVKDKGWSSFRAGYTNRMYSNLPGHCQTIGVGDKLLSTFEGLKTIESVTYLQGTMPTYQIVEAEHDNYHANGLLTLIEVNTMKPR